MMLTTMMMATNKGRAQHALKAAQSQLLPNVGMGEDGGATSDMVPSPPTTPEGPSSMMVVDGRVTPNSRMVEDIIPVEGGAASHLVPEPGTPRSGPISDFIDDHVHDDQPTIQSQLVDDQDA